MRVSVCACVCVRVAVRDSRVPKCGYADFELRRALARAERRARVCESLWVGVWGAWGRERAELGFGDLGATPRAVALSRRARLAAWLPLKGPVVPTQSCAVDAG